MAGQGKKESEGHKKTNVKHNVHSGTEIMRGEMRWKHMENKEELCKNGSKG